LREQLSPSNGDPPPVTRSAKVGEDVNVLWSATVASVIPIVLRRFRIDPAVVSAPFIATLVDGTGLIIYFEIAKLILPDLQ
ncbi:magnesium transporter, partial [Aeromonas caviae]|uniref:magnesium transporter n=1 Tax=Aeromonas caviae TaxID=648 RepID=UPI003A3075D3